MLKINHIMGKNTLKACLLAAFFLLNNAAITAQSQRKINDPMPSRQVHLDFHTSDFIPDIGAKFNKKQFQAALQTGHVNSINVFAKCHHSWSYYPTKIGKTHPNLTFDLLGEQLKACHEIGVKAPIYFTVGWSAADAEAHPEWCMRDKSGNIANLNFDVNAKPADPKATYSWKCLNAAASGPYHNFVLQQVEEICQRYPDLDGFWFDIYHIIPTDYSASSLERMKKEGVDIKDEAAVERSFALALKAHMTDLRAMVAKYHPKATVFFNQATHAVNRSIFKERLFDLNTHQDLEDLPSTWGGYDKLPLEAKFHLGQGTATTAMSGKFHKAWGEFGGFKYPDALRYEAAAMISNGVACNFGDQLHPSGEMDMETYKRIGYAYEYVEKIEKFGLGGLPTSRLGLWLTLEPKSDQGVANMLLETHNDFIVCNEQNLATLSVVIIPSKASLSAEQAQKLNDWAAKGGQLIVIGEGGLDREKKQFLLNIGANYVQKSPFDFDYTVITPVLQNKIVSTPFLNYESGLRVKPTTAKVLAHIREPYFNRTYAQYSGHRETPYKLENSEFPAVIQNGNITYFAHNIDQLYYGHGVQLHRQIFENVLSNINIKPLFNVKNLQSCGRVSFLKQAEQNRYVAHILYTPALQRGEVTVIEDFVPISNVAITVDVAEKVKKVYEIPSRKTLKFKREGNKIVVAVPTFTMHTGIVFEY
jgi:Hypothetical glycosyl hydrolase 6